MLKFEKRQIKAGVWFLIALLLVPSVIESGITPLAFCILFIILGVHTLREEKNKNGLIDDIPIVPKKIYSGYIFIVFMLWLVSLTFGLIKDHEYIDSFSTLVALILGSMLGYFVWGFLFLILILVPLVSLVSYFSNKKNV